MNFYQDTDTGITYADDEASIATGVNANISSEYSYPKNPVLPFPGLSRSETRTVTP